MDTQRMRAFGLIWNSAPINLAVIIATGASLASSASAQKPAPPKHAAAASAPAPAAQKIPKPTAAADMAAQEAQHTARLDAAIAPARNQAPSAEDAVRIRDSVSAFAAGDANKGRALRSQIGDPTGAKLVDWFRLRSGDGEPNEYRAFLDQNPAWPDRTLLTQRLEEAVFTRGGNARVIREHFTASEPKTGAGIAALASAYLAEGDEAKAKTMAAKAWRENDLAATLETGFLERFGKLLSEADHKRRLDRLLVDDIRWAGERNDRATFARRLIPLLSKPEQQKAQARLAVFMKAANAAQLMNALPIANAPDWGLAYHRVQVLRRADKDEEAWKLLLTVPTDPAQVANLDEWWVERRANAYEALKVGKPRVAYDLVKAVGPLSVNPSKDQAFFAGWLALRFLNDAKAAGPHFAAMRKGADGPLSVAKAEYWLGRSAEAMGDRDRAQQHYRAGSAHADTFHGQLARHKLEPGAQRIEVRAPQAPSAEEIARFNGLDAVKALVFARKSGLEAQVIRVFLSQLNRIARSEAESAMVAHLAEALGDTQMALRIGKAAIARGHNLLFYSYPIHPFPAYAPLRQPPETAVLLAIARQESEFYTQTVSGAGARGILQVMPITARHVCRDYQVKCDIPRLLSDPSYNTSMGSAYIGDRMSEFLGSYVLTFAGYNAGPGRARQWINEFGDPRDPKVDPIDWINRIPIEETREYVQKVLSNVQVYRARLGEPKTALRLNEDLLRARRAQ